MKTPVLLIIYNRLDTVKKVLPKIRECAPKKIYVAGDGAKENDETDIDKVNRVREYILDNIDWDTNIFTHFQPENLGAKYAVSNALKWFFSKEEKGIILEDDCLPAAGFFEFCDELLEVYENDRRIGMISGRNEFGLFEKGEGDYFLSTRGFTWGWATWKNRIEYLDVEIHKKLKLKDKFNLYKNSSSLIEFIYRLRTLQSLNKGTVDAWDYQWNICLLLNSFFTIVPKKNMIRNIGFGEDATHTKKNMSDLVDVYRLKKINHPDVLRVEKKFTIKTIRKETGGILKLFIPRSIIKVVKNIQ